MKKKIYIFIFIISFFWVGCIKFNHDYAQYPQLPPQKSFILDLPNYKHYPLPSEELYYNWNTAYSYINLWNNLVSKNVTYSYMFLDSVYSSNFSYFADKTWEQEYSFSDDSLDIISKTYATIEADSSVLYEMFFSVNSSNLFLTLNGYSNIDNTQGSWHFNKYALGIIPVLNINWYSACNSFDVSFSNVYKNSNQFGQKLNISYPTNPDVYNILIEVSTIGKQDSVFIQIDSISNKGRIMSFNNYNDSIWHYWNEDFKNE